jgi:hypothetical protein
MGLQILGRRSLVDLADEVAVVEGCSDSSSSEEEGSSSAESSLHSSALGYSAHEASTSWRVIGLRFSRLALRASKQYRQCSTVAMIDRIGSGSESIQLSLRDHRVCW